MIKTLIPILGVITAVTIAVITDGDIDIARALLLLPALAIVIFFFVSIARYRADKKDIFLCYGVAIGMVVSLGIAPWIFTIRFALAEDNLRIIAHHVQSGDPLSFPVWAGTFRISAGGIKEDGSLFLWTNANPSGPTGFVFGYKGSGYNVWSEMPLREDCYFISED